MRIGSIGKLLLPIQKQLHDSAVGDDRNISRAHGKGLLKGAGKAFQTILPVFRIRKGKRFVGCAGGIQLREAPADLIESQAVPLAHIQFPEIIQYGKRLAEGPGGLGRPQQRTGKQGDLPVCKFCPQQRSLKASQFAQGKIGPSQTHVFSVGKIRLTMADKVNITHQNISPKYFLYRLSTLCCSSSIKPRYRSSSCFPYSVRVL